MGAGMPANTGEAGAIHRVVCFAGMPAPTGKASTAPLGFSSSSSA
ncbi:diguanylate cyclase [Pseudomonas sp. AFG_SD02_1510_Pfu_092]|nr:diguanylate cyclase [Pseudomonas sp. AFG_SD02_1510_Pfu_092]